MRRFRAGVPVEVSRQKVSIEVCSTGGFLAQKGAGQPTMVADDDDDDDDVDKISALPYVFASIDPREKSATALRRASLSFTCISFRGLRMR